MKALGLLAHVRGAADAGRGSLLALASDHAFDHTSVSDSVTHDPPSRVCRNGCSAGDSASGGVNSNNGGERICADDGRLRRISLFLPAAPLLSSVELV